MKLSFHAWARTYPIPNLLNATRHVRRSTFTNSQVPAISKVAHKQTSRIGNRNQTKHTDFLSWKSQAWCASGGVAFAAKTAAALRRPWSQHGSRVAWSGFKLSLQARIGCCWLLLLLLWICLVAWWSSTKCRGTQKVIQKASGDPAPGAIQAIR